jgi:propionyl-CoA carboxylase alpha chain
MKHEAFRSGHFDTRFVEQYFKPEVLQPKYKDDTMDSLACLLAVHVFDKSTSIKNADVLATPAESRWKSNRSL